MAQRKVQGFSFQEVELRAVAHLAERLERGNKSGLLARLVRAQAKEEFGDDWKVIVSQPTETEKEVAV